MATNMQMTNPEIHINPVPHLSISSAVVLVDESTTRSFLPPPPLKSLFVHFLTPPCLATPFLVICAHPIPSSSQGKPLDINSNYKKLIRWLQPPIVPVGKRSSKVQWREACLKALH